MAIAQNAVVSANLPKPHRLDISVYDGKYRIIQEDSGTLVIYRHGEFWVQHPECGNCILAMAEELAVLRHQLAPKGG